MAGIDDKKRQANCFSFSDCQYDPVSGIATLSYDVDGLALEEKLVFPWAPWPVEASRQAAFYKALEILQLVAGISYYKAGLAPLIDTGEIRIDEAMAEFLNTLYLRGLGEFAYVNGLNLHDLIDFKITRATGDVATQSRSLALPERALVAMGGGKDSLVCLRLLQSAAVEVQPVCVGNSSLIGETVKAAGLPLIRIQRNLPEALKQLNLDGAWNGHVPVTAINSAILLCASILYGYRYVVFANEASANEATLKDASGRSVNHQFSKSILFEQGFRDVIDRWVSPDIEYFSLLRPFNETAITRQFTGLSEFHGVFSSCNRNFHQDGSHIQGRWCLDCPKCRFTALALAPFMQVQQLLDIQGADLLDREDQLEGFKALCGLEMPRPFECVGSIAECRALIKFLANKREWKNHYIVSCLAEFDEIHEAGQLELTPDLTLQHFIPADILARIDALQ